MRASLAVITLALAACSSPRAQTPDAGGTSPARGSGGAAGSSDVDSGTRGGVQRPDDALGGGSSNTGGAPAPAITGGAPASDAAGAPGTGGSMTSADSGAAADKPAEPPATPTCPAGFHLCAGTCVDARSINSCGTSCAPCPASPNGQPVCDGNQCSLACSAGFHLCGNTCASDTDAATCGTSCTPCPAPPANASASCDGQRCGFRCNVGFFDCAGVCKPDTSNVCGNKSLVRIPSDMAPPLLAQRKVTCLAGPDGINYSDCPVLRWGSYSYWVMADHDNSITMYITIYDAGRRVFKEIAKPGGRYIWKMSFTNEGVTFHGQDNLNVSASWAELRVDQP